MALTRSMLKGMNLTDEQVSAIIDAHKETVDALKDQRDTYKADADRLSDVQKQLDTYKNGKDWHAEYDKLSKAFDDYKADITGKETLREKQSAYRKLLTAENIPEKFHDRIIKMTDFADMELDGNAIKDEQKQRDTIKSEWGEFVATTQTRGAQIDTPPATGKGTMTRAEIMAIKDTSERQKAIAEHLDLFQNNH